MDNNEIDLVTTIFVLVIGGVTTYLLVYDLVRREIGNREQTVMERYARPFGLGSAVVLVVIIALRFRLLAA